MPQANEMSWILTYVVTASVLMNIMALFSFISNTKFNDLGSNIEVKIFSL